MVWRLLHLFALNLKVRGQSWLLPRVSVPLRVSQSPISSSCWDSPPPTSSSLTFLLPPPPPFRWCKLNWKVSSSGFLIQYVLGAGGGGTCLFRIHISALHPIIKEVEWRRIAAGRNFPRTGEIHSVLNKTPRSHNFWGYFTFSPLAEAVVFCYRARSCY